MTGADPLVPCANPEPTGFGDARGDFRATQLRYVIDFRAASHLPVNSTLLPYGTVAALEELIGNHRGLGGEQTEAFMLHPPDMIVTATADSRDLSRDLERPARDEPPPDQC